MKEEFTCPEQLGFYGTKWQIEFLGYFIIREFFEIPIKDAIDSIMKAKEHFVEFDIVTENDLNENDEDYINELEEKINNHKILKEKTIDMFNNYSEFITKLENLLNFRT